jgi:hypothetical protein
MKRKMDQLMLLGYEFIMMQMDCLLYSDTVSAGDLVAHNQSFGYVPPPAHANMTRFPHDGLLGLGHLNTSWPELWTNTSFYQTLHFQYQVKKYQFGLALGLNGTGSLILGGVDMDMMEDVPASQGILPGYEVWVIAGAITIGAGGANTFENQKLFISSGTEYVSIPSFIAYSAVWESTY